jgi:CHAT domain-containing protein
LHAVCQVDGRLTLRTLGTATEVEDLQQKLRFGLRRMAHPGHRATHGTSPADLVQTTARALDDMLLRPFPEIGDRSLVVVPTGVLHSMPWPVLPSVVGRPLTVSPSASLWRTAQARRPAEGHVVVAAGPDLPHADAEAKRVAEIYHVTPLTGPAATASEVLTSLDSAAVAHLAAHGRVRADNALFGSLRLADGPLMIYDLERLDQAPHTVIVAACDAGRPIVPAGDELLGLTATLLSQGTVQLIASSVPVLDAETAPLMVGLHELLAAGRPAADALAAAQERFAAAGPQQRATAASYLCFGAGFVAPPVAR